MGRTVQHTQQRRRRRFIFPLLPNKDVQGLILKKLNRYDLMLLKKALFSESTKLKLDECFTYDAAERGYLGLLEWAKENGYPLHGDLTEAAVGGGHLHVLQWIVKNQQGHFWGSWLCNVAIEEGHFKILKWLVHHGRSPDRFAATYAVKFCRWEMLKWLGEKKCLWESDVCFRLSELKRYDLLDWALENNVCSCDANERRQYHS